MSRLGLKRRSAGRQVGTPGGPARLITCCRSSAHPFLRAQQAQGRVAQLTASSGRAMSQKASACATGGPVASVFDICSVDTREAPDAQLSCSFEALAKQPWVGPRVLAAREESPWEKATDLAGGSESQGQLSWTVAQLIPSAPPRGPRACHSSPAAVQLVTWEASHSSVWASVSSFVV